ncbi:hypothetical protein Misp01_38540 [Microtetraspora sp. NBRC 13810]|nr:hypothetical protein Misp01_38540 [Microtetraspora sp. NBRC 13810]
MTGTRSDAAESHKLTKVWDAVDGLTSLASPSVAYHLALRVFFVRGMEEQQNAEPLSHGRRGRA